MTSINCRHVSGPRGYRYEISSRKTARVHGLFIYLRRKEEKFDKGVSISRTASFGTNVSPDTAINNTSSRVGLHFSLSEGNIAVATAREPGRRRYSTKCQSLTKIFHDIYSQVYVHDVSSKISRQGDEQTGISI